MTNPIIEEVRAARAALAAEHGYDIRRITEWARAQTAALSKSKANKALEKTGGAAKSPATRKRRVRPPVSQLRCSPKKRSPLPVIRDPAD